MALQKVTSQEQAERSRSVSWQDNLAMLAVMLQRLTQVTQALHSAVESLHISNALASVNDGIDFYAEIERFEIALIESALRCTKGSQVRAAELLGLNNTTLNSKIKLYEIDWKKLF